MSLLHLQIQLGGKGSKIKKILTQSWKGYETEAAMWFILRFPFSCHKRYHTNVIYIIIHALYTYFSYAFFLLLFCFFYFHYYFSLEAIRYQLICNTVKVDNTRIILIAWSAIKINTKTMQGLVLCGHLLQTSFQRLPTKMPCLYSINSFLKSPKLN